MVEGIDVRFAQRALGRLAAGLRLLPAAPLAAALVLLPGGAPSAGDRDEPPPEAVLAVMPFLDFPEKNRIVVDVAPEGHRPFPLMLDTGAVFSVVTPRMARALGVPVRRLKVDPYRRATPLGRDLLFYVDASLSDTGSPSGWEYGLLGGNFLADYVVEIDFAGRRLRLLDADRYAVPEAPQATDEATLSLVRVANRVALEVEVGGARLPVMLDTGVPDGLIVDAELSATAKIARRPELPFRFGTAWGEVAAELGDASGIAIGPFRFGRIPVVVLPNGWFNFALPKDAVIGVDLLSQFTVRIDYPRSRLWLRRRPDARVTWQGETWSGWPEASELAGAALTAPVSATRARADVAPEALVPARAAGPAPGPVVWLEVGAPAEGEQRLGRVPWAEVEGWAGTETPTRHDVMVLIDVSGSTAYACGTDVDGDGRLGKARRRIDTWRTYNPRHYSSDPGDTVLAAELVATRRLVEQLDPLRTRVGFIAFSDGAQITAPLGSDGDALTRTLGELDERFGSGATNLSAALDLAHHALVAAGGKGRRKSILVLSDGFPTAPGNPRRAADEARARAEEAALDGLRIHSFGLGLGEIEVGDVYAAIATRTGGRYVRLEQPGEILHELPLIDLAGVAGVEIENRTAGAPARAVRLFPDGSFDGFVRLVPGENVIRVTARGEGDAARSLERRLRFAPREPRDAAEARAFEAEARKLEQALEQRSLEIELTAEARARARQRQRVGGRVEVEIEPPGTGPADEDR
jgi:predicted aspartyl protease